MVELLTTYTKSQRRFAHEEMETYITRGYGEQIWTIFTNNPADMKRFQAKNFTLIKQVLYEDGSPESMTFEVPITAIILKNQVLTEEEKALAEKRRQWAIEQNAKNKGE